MLRPNQIQNGSDSVLDGLDDVAPPRAARAVAVVVLAAAALAVAHEDAGHMTHGAAAHVAPDSPELRVAVTVVGAALRVPGAGAVPVPAHLAVHRAAPVSADAADDVAADSAGF